MSKLSALSRPKRILVLCIFLSLILVQQSCTKIDSEASQRISMTSVEITQKFFSVPANAPSALFRIADVMKKQNCNAEFVTAFVRNNGYPLWDKAQFQKGSPHHQSSFTGSASFGEEDSVVIVPVSKPDSNYVNSFIKIRLEDGTPMLNFYRESDYSSYTFNRNVPADSITAEKAALQIMVLNKLVYGYSRYRVKDNRLFHYSNSPDSTERYVTLTDSTNYSGNSANLYEMALVCYQVDEIVSCDQNFSGGSGNTTGSSSFAFIHICHDIYTMCVEFPIWSSGGGGPSGTTGGGDTGGGGGGTPSDPSFPCASSQGKNIPIANPCGPNTNPPPIIPAAHNVEVQTVTNSINPNFPCLIAAFANITKPRLTNCLYQLYDETFVGTGSVHNLEILSGHPLVDANNVPVESKSRPKPLDPSTYQIALNEDFGHSYTREYWSSIILHELIHGFIQKNNLDFAPTSQFTNAHEIMLQAWTDEIKAALQEIYPSMSDTDAACLAVGGLFDILTDDVSQRFIMT